LRVGEEFDENITLAVRFDEENLLIDAIRGLCDWGDGNLDRIIEQVAGELGDFAWHGRREKEVLALLREIADDAADRLDETEIEHLIDFVEDEKLGLAEMRDAGVKMIDKTAGGRDQNIEAARERLDLSAMWHAAEYDGDGNPQARAEAAEAFGDLARKFARRAQDQHATAAARRRTFIGYEMMENWQSEGGGFAGSGLSYSDEVTACHDVWNSLRLDRRRT